MRTTRTSARHPRSASVLAKVPLGLLAAAALITAFGARGGAPTADQRLVANAIEAPFADVGIMPVEDSVAFWQGRVDGDATDYLSRSQLASSLMALARETGDLSLYSEAESVLEEALALNPNDERSLLGLAAARAAAHDFAGAITLAQRVLARDPSSEAARAVLADADFELGRYERASRRLDELTRTWPEGPGVASRLAKRAAIEGRLDVAIRVSADAVVAASELDLRPGDAAFFRFQLGHFLAQAGRFGEAIAALDAALAIEPDHLASLEAKASVLVSLERLEEAAAVYQHLIELGPAADLYGELAKIHRALGRDGAAEQAVATGLALGHEQLGSSPAERRHLAEFFADHEPETAVQAARADFETRKDVGAYDTLAWAYFQDGQPEVAARYVAGALAQGTRDVELLYHAGMIEAAVGHTDRAAALLRDALELDPHFDLVHAPRAAAALASLTHEG